MLEKIDYSFLKLILGDYCDFIGNQEIAFTKISSIYEATNGELTWVKHGIVDEKEVINNTQASGVICSSQSYELYTGSIENKLFIINNNPKSVFTRILVELKKKNLNQLEPFIHPTALIHSECQIGKNVSVGPYSIIGKCKIGENSIIEAHVIISDNVSIGNNCWVREHCSVGGQGFGYSREKSSSVYQHIPHIGGVIIDDHVHLYPYVNVDAGTLGSTKIGRNSLIDHFAHIGHNTVIGENNIIAAKTVCSGGVVIGDNNFIGVGTKIKEKCKIGSNSILGIGSVVTKNIPDREIWYGNPAVKKSDVDENFRIFGL